MTVHESDGAVGSIIGRVFLGGIVWLIGTAVLVGLVLLSAIPYGGGSAAPLYLVIPWTAAVVYWALRPLKRTALFSAPVAMPLLFLVVFASIIGALYWRMGRGDRERARETREFASAFEPHSNYFKSKCVNAGPKTFRQVRDIDGFVVYGLRVKTEPSELLQKNFVGDVYSGFDLNSDPARSFARNFLTKMEWEARWHTPTAEETTRYSYVEIPAEVDGVSGFYRYTDASEKSQHQITREFVTTTRSSYAVRIEDISSAADREHWIAGAHWSIIDLKTAEVLGQFTGYAIDLVQGQTHFQGSQGAAGGPVVEPWLRAGSSRLMAHGLQNACPKKDIYDPYLGSRDFVRSVLVPAKQAVRIIPAS